MYVESDGEMLDVNRELVRGGFAWHYKRYSDDENLADAEDYAREHEHGLWQDPWPVAPWFWGANRPRADEAIPPNAAMWDGAFWLNTATGVRHNFGCLHFGRTKQGRVSTAVEGRPCGICGG